MFPWIQLEDQHVVDSRRPPAVYIDADEKYKLHEEERTAVQSEGGLEIFCGTLVENTFKTLENTFIDISPELWQRTCIYS